MSIRVNNNIPSEYSAPLNKAAKVGGNEHFSLDSAMDNSSDQGVIYESSQSKDEKASVTSDTSKQSPKKDSFENSLQKAQAEQAKEEQIKQITDQAYRELWQSVKNFFSGLWKNIRTFFGNVWDSKPINEGIEDILPGQNSKNSSPDKATVETEKINELNSEIESGLDSELNSELNSEFNSELNSEHNSEHNSELNSEFDSELDSGQASELDTATDSLYETDIDRIEASRDEKIKKALEDGDKDTFRDLITAGGRIQPARNSSTLTTYNAKGRIVDIDPSDENKILHGNRGTRNL